MENCTLIRDKRLALSLSQEWVADQVGVSQSHYSRLENGKVPIHPSLLKRIGQTLDLSPESLQSQPKVLLLPPPADFRYWEALLTEKDARLKQLLDEVNFLRRQLDLVRESDNRQYTAVFTDPLSIGQTGRT
jgi:transcriptional regulator with XRE-family HTH domain